MRKIGILRCVLSLAVVGLVSLGGCQSKVETALAPVVKPAKEQVKLARAETGRNGQGSTIGVKGVWKIEVRDPDGSVVKRHEFQNALDPTGGPALLGKLLTGAATYCEWEIWVEGVSSTTGNPITIEICSAPSRCSSGTVTVEQIPEGIRLAGSFIASFDRNLRGVQTVAYLCSPDVSATDCIASELPTDGDPFTSHDFAAAGEPTIDVVAGQQVQIVVEFHFVAA